MENIIYEKKERIAIITLDRAEKRNALSYELVKELREALTTAEEDTEVKAIILKAEGNTFCAGADLAYLQKLQEFSYEENLDDSKNLMELFRKIYTMGKVVIAQVQGHAIAGGCGLAAVCDFSFVAPEAKFGYTEVRIGFVPAIVSIFLIRKIGEAKTRQMLLSGDLIDATAAKNWGLINYIVPSDELEEKVFDFVQKICISNSGESMAYTKKLIAEVPSLGLVGGLEYATEINAQARSGKDCKSGIAAFLNKEKITW
ncbi:MAG: enoyl-CoA hydratase/isomerase family protein [Bacteroidota bacterium]|nr:enoyl-CoA hydratase/isomerase family protein [Bacteroidota bacterium]